MTQTSTRLVLALSLAAAAGCADQPGAGVQLRAVSSGGGGGAGAPLVAEDDAGTAFALVAATLDVRDIRLDLPDGLTCADVQDTLVGARCEPDDDTDGSGEDTIVIDGPFAVDLVAGTASPSLDDVVIPEASYRRVDIRVDAEDDVSFAATADFQHDGLPHRLELALDFSEDIRIEEAQGVEVTADTDLVAEFVVNSWLGGIDLIACLEDGDLRTEGDVVYLDDSSSGGACSDVENVIKDNMKNSGQFDRD